MGVGKVFMRACEVSVDGILAGWSSKSSRRGVLAYDKGFAAKCG